MKPRHRTLKIYCQLHILASLTDIRCIRAQHYQRPVDMHQCHSRYLSHVLN